MLELFEKGGVLMYPILFCSILALAIFLERIWFYSRFIKGHDELISEVDPLIAEEKFDQASVACQRFGNPLSRIYATAIRLAGRSRAQIKAVVEEAGSREVAPLERYLGLLGTIATITPLLGLLGTVLGMIRAFTIISAEGVGTPATLGGGISEALITTAAGLTVAIPTILLHKYLTGRVDRMALDLEVKSLRVVDRLGK
ncbi:MAG: MotA/TolQ/ExbB proton channel family protein [Desulfuromonas sp.]|nr:MAG: MotA/TolQ/ExbB proton channel family protein [Desulfuromonas sp.]